MQFDVVGKGGISAKVIKHSIDRNGREIFTLQLKYPRFIHSEFMTHRVFSRNAMSSRAVPVAKMLDQVRKNPAMPIHWGKNQPGMQAYAESDDLVQGTLCFPYPNCVDWDDKGVSAEEAWRRSAEFAAHFAEQMSEAGYHKQVVNRILEPFQFMHVVVTSTEWENFFALRDHEAAEPNIQELAQVMRQAMTASKPELLQDGEWHLPYVLPAERATLPLGATLKISAARCARVSYIKHDGTDPDLDEDIALFDRLVGSEPLHASPIEHQAMADTWQRKPHATGNFKGWVQFRKLYELYGKDIFTRL